MNDEPDEALEVLRTVWTAQEQDTAALAEASGPAKGCKRMSDIGFGGMAGPDGDLGTAWKDRLAREGKLNPGATGSIRDLVLGGALDGPSGDRRPADADAARWRLPG